MAKRVEQRLYKTEGKRQRNTRWRYISAINCCNSWPTARKQTKKCELSEGKYRHCNRAHIAGHPRHAKLQKQATDGREQQHSFLFFYFKYAYGNNNEWIMYLKSVCLINFKFYVIIDINTEHEVLRIFLSSPLSSTHGPNERTTHIVLAFSCELCIWWPKKLSHYHIINKSY